MFIGLSILELFTGLLLDLHGSGRLIWCHQIPILFSIWKPSGDTNIQSIYQCPHCDSLSQTPTCLQLSTMMQAGKKINSDKRGEEQKRSLFLSVTYIFWWSHLQVSEGSNLKKNFKWQREMICKLGWFHVVRGEGAEEQHCLWGDQPCRTGLRKSLMQKQQWHGSQTDT